MRTKEALCSRIHQLCTDNSLSINGLSARSGITQSTLNNIVSGRNNSATVSTVKKICDGLDISLREFFDCDLFDDLEQEIY